MWERQKGAVKILAWSSSLLCFACYSIREWLCVPKEAKCMSVHWNSGSYTQVLTVRYNKSKGSFQYTVLRKQSLYPFGWSPCKSERYSPPQNIFFLIVLREDRSPDLKDRVFVLLLFWFLRLYLGGTYCTSQAFIIQSEGCTLSYNVSETQLSF